MTQNSGGNSSTLRNALIYAAVIVMALLFWQLRTLLLLMFGGVLVAMILSLPTDWLVARTGLPRALVYSVVALLLGVFLAVAIGVFGWRMSGQFTELGNAISNGLQEVSAKLPDWARSELQQLRSNGVSGFASDWVGRVAGAAGFFLTALANILLVFFIGVFLGANPKRYRDGIIALFPAKRQKRIQEVLDSCSNALRQWLIGQFVSMVLIGLSTFIGLWLLDMPMALSLGLLAGLFEFVPIIGPVAAAVPALLLAFTVDPMLAVWVGLLYLGIQQIESNVLLPVIQKWAVAMPPVIALIAGVSALFVFGLLGAIFAVPLALLIMVLIGKLYIEDILGQTYSGPGSGPPG